MQMLNKNDKAYFTGLIIYTLIPVTYNKKEKLCWYGSSKSIWIN